MPRPYAHSRTRLVVVALAALLPLAAACGTAKTSSGGGGGTASAAPGVTKSTIVFGQTVPKSGPAALYGQSTSGVQAYFDYVNAHGGVGGRQLKLISLDDQYQPPVAVQQTRKLISDGVFAEVAVNGSATTNAILNVVDPQNIPVVGPQTGATFLQPLRKNVYNVWPAYTIEGKLLGSYAMNSLHLAKVGVIYQNDDFGKSLLQGVTESGLHPTLSLPYDPTQTDFGPQAGQLKAAGVQGVILLSIPAPTIAILNAFSAINYAPVRLMSQVSAIPKSFSAAPLFPGSYIGAFIPPLANSSDPQVQQFTQAMATYQPGQPVSVFAAWGWAEAQVAVAGLKAAKGALTRDSYEQGLNSLSNLSTLAGPISYSATDHTGTKHMFLVKAAGGHRVPVPGS